MSTATYVFVEKYEKNLQLTLVISILAYLE